MQGGQQHWKRCQAIEKGTCSKMKNSKEQRSTNQLNNKWNLHRKKYIIIFFFSFSRSWYAWGMRIFSNNTHDYCLWTEFLRWYDCAYVVPSLQLRCSDAVDEQVYIFIAYHAVDFDV